MRSTASAPSTPRCLERALAEERAQATVEAAILLPGFLILLLVCLQPVCLLYTRSIMESAAASTARLMITAGEEGDDAHRAFALRRLGAIPNVAIFHAGGPLSWEIELAHGGEEGAVRVSITGFIRPLPVIGVFAEAFGNRNAQGDVEMSVEVAYEGRPEWLEGSYETWIAEWE